MNPAAPKMIQIMGNSGDSVFNTSYTVVVRVTFFVRTGIVVTGRVVMMVVDSDFICCMMVTKGVGAGVVVGAPA
ncbi:MAG: hypothetical protein LUQ04_06625, partial [Methanoregula sp.]|nr:hypothetical protein [Methanoregula sp.]